MWIDTHCHLEKAQRARELPALLDRMQKAGVHRCVTIGTSPEDWDLYFRLAKRYAGLVDWTVGLHPGEAGEEWEDAVQALSTFFTVDPLPVALGEIGLDYFHLPKYPDEAVEVKKRQQTAFTRQLELAYQLDVPVVIHSRNAVPDCIRLIDESGIDWNKVVFHCFTEGPEALRPILDRGGRASFTGILTYKNSYATAIREALREQGPGRLMLETDCPYLTPEPLRGQPNEPAHMMHTARKAAEILGMEETALAEQTTANAQAFYQLK